MEMYSEKRKWCVRVIKITLLIVLLYFITIAIIERIGQVEWSSLTIDFKFLMVTIIAAFAVRICISVFYVVILRRLNYSLPYHVPVAVSLVANLGKYVPGKMAIFSGVIYLLNKYRVRMSVSAIIPTLSNAMSVLIAMILSIPLLFNPWVQELIPFSSLWFIFSIAICGLIIWPRIFFGITNMVLRLMGQPLLNIVLTFRKMMLPVCLVLLQCICSGLATWSMARTLTPIMDFTLVLHVISISAFAGALGVIALFAPAGLGVLEGVYLVMLSPLIGSDLAALVAVCLRFLQTVVDVLVALAGIIILRYSEVENECYHG